VLRLRTETTIPSFFFSYIPNIRLPNTRLRFFTSRAAIRCRIRRRKSTAVCEIRTKPPILHHNHHTSANDLRASKPQFLRRQLHDTASKCHKNTTPPPVPHHQPTAPKPPQAPTPTTHLCPLHHQHTSHLNRPVPQTNSPTITVPRLKLNTLNQVHTSKALTDNNMDHSKGTDRNKAMDHKEDITSPILRWDTHSRGHMDRRVVTVPKEDIITVDMRRGMDLKDSTWMIGGVGVRGSWRRCWLVWRVVVVWMLVCCFNAAINLRVEGRGVYKVT